MLPHRVRERVQTTARLEYLRGEGKDKEADELGAAFDVVDNWLGKEYAACRLDEDKKSESCVD
jgi:hypothetical protein